jgi:hypothetical protein
MPGLSGRPEWDVDEEDEVDPGTEAADLSVYTQEDLFDPSECGVAK